MVACCGQPVRPRPRHAAQGRQGAGVTGMGGLGSACGRPLVTGGGMRAVRQRGFAVAAIAAGVAITVWPAYGAGGVSSARPPLTGYVLAGQTNKLDRLNPATDRMLRPVTLSRAPDAMAIAPGGR